MASKRKYEKENPENCYSRRAFNNHSVTESQLANEHGLIEYADVYSFLEDYAELDPVPFLELMEGALIRPKKESTLIKSRQKLCAECNTSLDPLNIPDCEKEFSDTFQTGWKVMLNQNQQQSNPLTGKEDDSGESKTITMHDVRLDGKPAMLHITRSLWKSGGKRIPVQVIPYVQASVKEQMTLRLMGAINDAYIRTGNNVNYIAEAYGISLSNLYSHITQSAGMLRKKAQQENRDSYLSQNWGRASMGKNKELLPFVLAGKKAFGLFEFPHNSPKGGKLLEIYAATELRKINNYFTKYFETKSILSLTHAQACQLDYLADYWLAKRESRNGLPAELIYGIICLCSEITKQFARIKYEYPEPATEKMQGYLDQVITPLIHNIFLNETPIDESEIHNFAVSLYRFNYFPDVNRINKYLGQIDILMDEWISQYERILSDWERDFSLALTPMQKDQVKAATSLISKYSSSRNSGLSFSEIKNSIFINMATVPYGGSRQVLTNALGLLDMNAWGETGVDLYCLCHLVKGGLFSRELHHKPKCLYYENAEFFEDKCNSDYCYQCQFFYILEMNSLER